MIPFDPSCPSLNMDAAETPLEQTARHVREGDERIANQRSLIERLKESDPGDMLAAAEQFLLDMLAFQEQGREHLAREQAKLPTA